VDNSAFSPSERVSLSNASICTEEAGKIAANSCGELEVLTTGEDGKEVREDIWARSVRLPLGRVACR
jgi:hypothetical protein